jgi:hypothetical protein
MSKRKKILRILIVTIGGLLVLLLAVQFIVPRLINLEPVKEKILASASQKVGGEVKCERVGLSLFPYPHAVIDQVSLSIPGKVSGSLDTLDVYLQFLPLLRGKIKLEEVTLKSPEFKVALPKKATKKPEKELPETSLDIPAISSQILVPLILEVPNLEVEIENGKLDLSQEDETLFSFESIVARIVLTSNLWDKMEVKSTLNATDYKGELHIELNNFQPHRLTSQLTEDSPLKLADSSVNMSVDINVNGLNNLQANVQGSIPFITFQNGMERKNWSLKAKA